MAIAAVDADDRVHQLILLTERLTGGDVRLDLVEGGDHRLSGPDHLRRLLEAVERLRD